MKRDRSNAVKLISLSEKDVLLKKQINDALRLSPKETAVSMVRLGRMRGLYFSEHDWNEVMNENKSFKKAA